ncbi:hypothetical protein A2U01_0018509, partial [Trifolium medium]|nr:hypothetical protein [Trifolium medium]
AQSAEAARGSMHVSRPAPTLAAPRANTSRFTRIFSDFLLPRFQGIFNNYGGNCSIRDGGASVGVWCSDFCLAQGLLFWLWLIPCGLVFE